MDPALRRSRRCSVTRFDEKPWGVLPTHRRGATFGMAVAVGPVPGEGPAVAVVAAVAVDRAGVAAGDAVARAVAPHPRL